MHSEASNMTELAAPPTAESDAPRVRRPRSVVARHRPSGMTAKPRRRTVAVVATLAVIAATLAASSMPSAAQDPSWAAFCVDDHWTEGNRGQADFGDVSDEQWATIEIDCVHHTGVALGYTPNSYEPESKVTRAEAAMMLSRIWRASGFNCPAASSLPFEDVADDHWAIEGIACAYGLLIMHGITTTQFGPEKTIPRAYVAIVLAGLWRSAGLTCGNNPAPFLDISPDHFAAKDINCLYDVDVFYGTTPTDFQADRPTTRAEMAALISRLWRRLIPALYPPVTAIPPVTYTPGSPSSGILQADPALPGPPRIDYISRQNQQVQVFWFAPSNTGSSAITSYTLDWLATDGAGGRRTSISPNSPCTRIFTPESNPVTGLTNGKAYTFKVRAHNSEGAGPWSTAAIAAPNLPPSQVTEYAVRASAPSGQINFTHTSPHHIEYPRPTTAAPSNEYTYLAAQWKRTDAGNEQEYCLSRQNLYDFESGVHTDVISGLVSGATYCVRVRARSTIADGNFTDGTLTDDDGNGNQINRKAEICNITVN